MGSTAAAVQWLSTRLPEIEKDLALLVNTNSFTGNVAGGNDVVASLLEVFKMEDLAPERIASKQFADHLVFQSAGSQGIAPVVLIGHSDTVFPPGLFEGYRADGSLRRGPGVLDMKGGLVVIAWALKAIAHTVGLESVPSVRVVIVSDEEVGSPEGAPLIQRVAAGCSASLVFESGRENDAIVTRRKGAGACKCVAHGTAAHAGNNYWDGANAIWALSKFVDSAQQLSNEAAGVTVNVGLISGGTAKNSVPALASAELDLRYRDIASMNSLMRQLREIAALAPIPGTRLEIVDGPARPPLEASQASLDLMNEYARCAKAHGLQGDEAPLQGGGSDANTTSALGIPSIDGLGPRGRFFHTPNEYIEVDTLIPRASALAQWLIERVK